MTTTFRPSLWLRSLSWLTVGLLVVAGPVLAQGGDWPQHALTVVMTFPAGSGVDVVARHIQEPLGKQLGQPVVIDYKPGAAGNIASEFVARAKPDGYTLVFGTAATHGSNAALYKKLSFDVENDFVPVAPVLDVSNVLTINPDVINVKTLKEFVDLVKANPGKYNYGSAGAGGPTHIQVDAFLRQEGLQMTHVAYKGIAPAAQDLLSGQVQAMVAGSSAATPHIASGKMKVLAINGTKRAKALPNVPTFAEAGFPNTEMYFYLGLTGPKGIPKAIVDQIASDTRKVLADQTFVEKTLDVFGFDPIGETPEQFAEFLKRDRALAKKKIRDADVKFD